MISLIALLQELASVLKDLNWQLVTAESCTGGLIASSITDLPGSSAWFERGFITYSNLAKQEMLDVSEELIIQHGAVSKEVAGAMVTGALHHSVGQIALAVTGIAGPDGGSIEKPVGTVCFAWAIRDLAPQILKKRFQGTRQEIRLAAAYEALNGVLTLIKKRSR
ncbi:CinA family protein [Legionella sp. km772]|uniref:CinA family protein n=1 Tax=Legionella sp. km772 TaxID=2498111 RepID=UPI000F8DBFC2|nr:CinA family protein [Legionella sp. km772]RUR13904.1 CinA family protein [Legionella sp. km772]